LQEKTTTSNGSAKSLSLYDVPSVPRRPANAGMAAPTGRLFASLIELFLSFY
jgi:hypothetical protein